MIINELSSDVSYTSDYFWLLNINKGPLNKYLNKVY